MDRGNLTTKATTTLAAIYPRKSSLDERDGGIDRLYAVTQTVSSFENQSRNAVLVHTRCCRQSSDAAAIDEYGAQGFTHDACLLELYLDHDQRLSSLDEARFDRRLVLVELDAVDLGVPG